MARRCLRKSPPVIWEARMGTFRRWCPYGGAGLTTPTFLAS